MHKLESIQKLASQRGCVAEKHIMGIRRYQQLNTVNTVQLSPVLRHRTTLLSTVAMFIFLIALALQSAEVKAQSLVPIAVVDFTTSIRNTNYTRRLPELIIDELVNSGEFDVLEREKMDSLAGELNFQAGALVDPAKAVQIGGMSGARLIVTGNIVAVSYTHLTLPTISSV